MRSVQLFETDIFCLVKFFDIRFKEILLGSKLSQFDILIGMVNNRIFDIEGITKGERVENEPSINGECTVENAMGISFENIFQQFQRREDW